MNGIQFVFDPARLSQARKALGMTKKDLAQKTSVTPSAITQFESGIISPSAENIENMARSLQVSPDYFKAGRPMFRSADKGIHFRSLRSTSVRDRDKAASYIERLWELVNFFESEVQLPQVDIPLYPSAKYLPEDAARIIRKEWDMKPGPVQNLTNFIEFHGTIVSILNLPEGEKIGAFSVWSHERPLILINPGRTKNVYVQRFTLAHELGHLVMHDEVIPGDKDQEREADRFAAEFLLPKDIIKYEIPNRIDISKYELLSQRWGVSVEALLYRAKELGISSEQSIRRGFMNLNLRKSGNNIYYPPSNMYPGELPKVLSRAAEVIEEEYSIAEISDVIKIPPKFIRLILGESDRRPTLKLLE